MAKIGGICVQIMCAFEGGGGKGGGGGERTGGRRHVHFLCPFFFCNIFNEMQTRHIAKAVRGSNKEQMFADKLSLVAFYNQSQNTSAVAL